MKRKGDVLYDLLDSETREAVTYKKTALYADGTPMNDAKAFASGGLYQSLETNGVVEYFIKSLDLSKSRTLIVENIQALRNMSKSDAILIRLGYYRKVQTKGYYVAADGGGASYNVKIDADGPDDGFLIIRPVTDTNIRFTPVLRGSVDARVAGVKGDGVGDDSVNLQKAFNSGLRVLLPKPVNFYKVSEPLTLKNNVYGFDSKFITDKATLFNVFETDNVILQGVDGSSTLPAGGAAPYFAYAVNSNNFQIISCKIRGRVYNRNTTMNYIKDFTFESNVVDLDFTNYEHLVAQNDGFTCAGIQNVHVRGNSFNFKNTHRGFKFQDTLANAEVNKTSAYRCKNIYMSDNTIVAESDSGKQLIDIYNNTSNFNLTNNHFDVKNGYSYILENKSFAEVDYKDNFKIIGNTFKYQNGGLFFSGNYGSTIVDSNKGRKSLTVYDNDFEVTRTGYKNNAQAVAVKFFHNVSISDNTFSNLAQNFRAVEWLNVSSNKNAVIDANIFEKGGIVLARLLTDPNATVYDPKIRSVIVSGNTFDDLGGEDYQAAIKLDANTEGHFRVSGNYAGKYIEDGLHTSLLRVAYQTIQKLILGENIVSDLIDVPFQKPGSTIGKLNSANNSWEEAVVPTNPTATPVATESVFGTVKRARKVSFTAAQAAGSTPTKLEFDKVVADLYDLKMAMIAANQLTAP